MTSTFIITTVVLFIGTALAIGKYDYMKSVKTQEL